VFDKDGRVTTGPAPSPLANLRVTVCDGRVFVGAELVPAGTRVAVG
jgi:Rieske Fe-S protein